MICMMESYLRPRIQTTVARGRARRIPTLYDSGGAIIHGAARVLTALLSASQPMSLTLADIRAARERIRG
ncbi:MAG TPA: hypothetical protein VLE53_15530, partial [Gemmatimonadaceae bacterium]|nr:hypothetical protein [Gemmatimonadaceae bacterium]